MDSFWMDKWLYEWLDGYMGDGCMDGWIVLEWINDCMMDGVWMLDRWMDGRMDYVIGSSSPGPQVQLLGINLDTLALLWFLQHTNLIPFPDTLTLFFPQLFPRLAPSHDSGFNADGPQLLRKAFPTISITRTTTKSTIITLLCLLVILTAWNCFVYISVYLFYASHPLPQQSFMKVWLYP